MTDPARIPTPARPDASTWLQKHGDALFRYALLHTGDATVAEDAVQEALLAALQSADRFDFRSSERTWLIGILKHKMIDHLRRPTRESGAGDVGAADESVAGQFTSRGTWSTAPRTWSSDPVQAFAAREFWDVLTDCLARLPVRLAFAFCQRELEDSSTVEICKVLDVSATNLWTLLHRARTRLRRCLETNWFRHDA
jgi:RNA polymerase sigma-70 factor (ECF subfamily)